MNSLAAVARRIAHLVWHRRVRASLERPDACVLFGLDLVIEPGVLHPQHFASSRVLAEHVAGLDLRGRNVADIGTGSGLQALIAARAGAGVTAVDINGAAVACAAGNAQRNGLAARIRAIESDVFDQVPAEPRFDLVITNPPFYPREAGHRLDHAFAAGTLNDFFTKLTESLPERLASGGAVVMIHSSDADFTSIGRMFENMGLVARVVRERRGFFETLTIREFRAPT